MRPSLNAQSCIKGLLVVWDFCFLAVWAAGPVHKKKLGADYEQSLANMNEIENLGPALVRSGRERS